MRRGMALLAALALLLSCIAWEAAAEESVRMGRTEPLYSQARAGYTLPVYGKEPVRVETDLTLSVGDSARVEFTVPEDGTVRLTLNGETYTGVFTRALDGAQSAWVTCFTALNEKGEAVWGIRTDDIGGM